MLKYFDVPVLSVTVGSRRVEGVVVAQTISSMCMEVRAISEAPDVSLASCDVSPSIMTPHVPGAQEVFDPLMKWASNPMGIELLGSLL